MANSSNTDQGIRLLVQKCRNEFRRPENIYYYSENDFKEAEKRFVKFCLTGNPNSNSGWLFAVNHKISRGGRLHSPFCFPLVKGSLCMCRLPFWLCKKVFIPPPLNFQNIVLFSCDFWDVCAYFCRAENLATASWKLHPLGGGSNWTAPFWCVR